MIEPRLNWIDHRVSFSSRLVLPILSMYALLDRPLLLRLSGYGCLSFSASLPFRMMPLVLSESVMDILCACPVTARVATHRSSCRWGVWLLAHHWNVALVHLALTAVPLAAQVQTLPSLDSHSNYCCVIHTNKSLRMHLDSCLIAITT